MREYLEFEKPLIKFDERIEKLKTQAQTDPQVRREIEKIEREALEVRAEIYASLSPWQRIQLARHPSRPHTLDYISLLITNFVELHGDRLYGDDSAMITGVGMFHHRPLVVIGSQKGKVFKEQVKRNFGMPHPEGYRKALRMMKMAEKFGRPVLTLIDTPGAYPGKEAEERGQAGAIANNLFEMARLKVPIVAVIIGEGGSGGALALGVADRVLMLEHSIYSVISPEGCAAILWKDAAKAPEAANALKMTANDLYGMGIIDQIVAEPLGGAHKDPTQMAESLGKALVNQMSELDGMPMDDLIEQRYQKYKNIGVIQSENERRGTDPDR